MRSPYEPDAAEVIAREGKPKTVKHRGRFLDVREILNVWRGNDEWWRKPISRLYYLVELTNGSRFTVSRDLIAGKWYRQNVV
jgi:hypothetical protein